MASHPFFGLLNLNKPAGMTSRRAVDVVAKLVKPAKAGHAGTLDPLANGVLLVCVGKATRLVPYLHELPKTYRATFLLGRRSNTDDLEGEVVESNVSGTSVKREQIETLLSRFCGRIEQVPPQFSAVHVHGRRAYKLARRGAAIVIPPRTVEVHRIEMTAFEPPEFELEIECGTGTYIRSIGRDLGELLGCGAVMSALVRTRIGPFGLGDAVDPACLTADTLRQHLLPAALAVGRMRRRECTGAELQFVARGRAFSVEEGSVLCDGETVALLSPGGELAAIAQFRLQENLLAPVQVFLSAGDA